ncbi:hypothetical protein [Thalassobacillus hwangdonensis]|uniref:Uncharacterized protein n=1 Tax=Thalassobacillus hwangdonensis TaxID=546108 RepID=A0ABW3KZ79_9BACI
MKRTIICHYCKKKIVDRDELITGARWFKVKPFHMKCFGQLEEETAVFVKSWKPLNGIPGNTSFLIMLAIFLWMFLTDQFGYVGDIIGAVSLYPIGLRILSFLLIESTLPKISPEKEMRR